MTKLLVLSPAPVETGGGRTILDVKFASGMNYYAQSWDGQVDCALYAGDSVPFRETYDPARHGFGVHVFDPAKGMPRAFLEGYDVILADGDSHRHLDLPETLGRRSRVVYVIEYILETRFQILRVDRNLGPLRKLRSAAWNLGKERLRRKAFAGAAGIQANGYPAYEAYRGLNANTICYLDNRMSRGSFATEAEMEARAAHLLGGGALRLVHSGRLEPMKGSQDIVPIARALQAAGVDFTLDIFGSGSLAGEIAAGIGAGGLAGRVRLHAPVDFETGLVPFARQNADAYLSCHRQSDPSCSYLENMGCGLAVFGYDNRMWGDLAKRVEAGWVAPLGDAGQLAQRIITADADRADFVARSRAAWDFARAHAFETEFESRIAQLRALVA